MKKVYKPSAYQQLMLMALASGNQLVVHGGVFLNGQLINKRTFNILLKNEQIKPNEDGLFLGCSQTYGANK